MMARPEEIKDEGQALTVVQYTPANLLAQAVQSGNLEMAAKMMDLQDRWDTRERRQLFDEALTKAKGKLPVIVKDKEVRFGTTHYRHATLGNIAAVVTPILSEHGLKYTWKTDTVSVPGMVTVICKVSGFGHTEENSLSGPLDTSGSKNAIQQMGSTVTYLERYTLMAALGLSSAEDNDDRSSSPAVPLSDAQAAEITRMISASGADIDRFLKWLEVESISDIPADRYSDAIGRLSLKKQRAEKK